MYVPRISGYPHDGRADNNPYPHDRRAYSLSLIILRVTLILGFWP